MGKKKRTIASKKGGGRGDRGEGEGLKKKKLNGVELVNMVKADGTVVNTGVNKKVDKEVDKGVDKGVNKEAVDKEAVDKYEDPASGRWYFINGEGNAEWCSNK